MFTGGSITSELKNKWGLNTVWKEIIKPRFERLEKIIGQPLIVPDEEYPNKFHLHPPDPSIELKRIDHRHHALDALIIAATTREHIRYLNSLNSADTNEEIKAIRLKLVKGKIREFHLPWPDFTKDAKNKLNEVIISFKTNNKVVSKPSNKYLKWVNENGKSVKKFVSQKPNNKWLAVRKSIFKEPQGIIYLKEIKQKRLMEAVKVQLERQKGDTNEQGKPINYIYDKNSREQIKMIINRFNSNEKEIKQHLKKNALTDYKGNAIEKVNVAEFVEYAAKRVEVDKTFTYDKINKIPYATKIIEKFSYLEKKKKLPDETLPIAFLLKKHLDAYNGEPQVAFTTEGLDDLFKKAGRPIRKVTIFEKKKTEDKFKGKYVETDKGGIVYFVIYEDTNGNRDEMYSLSVHQVIERIFNGKPIAEDKEGYKKIILSPNELVYVPTQEELEKKKIDWKNKENKFNRIYKMMSSTGEKCEFIPHFISKSLLDNIELGSGNKNQRAWDGKIELVNKEGKDKSTREDTGTMIKEICVKIKIDRLGNIFEVDGEKVTIYD